MNFFIVFCKTKKKFDKYIKINRIRNKVIVDICELQKEYDVTNKDYFNLMVYTKINHALKKGKDIYYIPDFKIKKKSIQELFKLKDILNVNINFNALIFYHEFVDESEVLSDIFDNIPNFNVSQIIKDY
jgi:hypothetical protein